MSFLLIFRTGYTRINIWTTLQTRDRRAPAGQLKKIRRKRSRAIRAGRGPFSDGRRARLHKPSRLLFFNLLSLFRAGHVYMQIWVFLFPGDGVNLAKGGGTTGAHPQAGTALDRFIFAYIFPFLPLFYYSFFAKNHDVWMTASTTTSLPVIFPLFICLFVYICVNKRVFSALRWEGKGMWIRYFRLVWFVVIYQPGAS
jgi:hypothetical protein